MIFFKDKLTVKIFSTRQEMGKVAAQEVAARIENLLLEREYINIVFASAPSQDDFLDALMGHTIEWEKVNAFHMDEYIGLDEEAPQGFGNYLKVRVFDKVHMRKVFYLGKGGNAEEEKNYYTALLKKYPPDIVFLGIGENGHIAFNDPHAARFDDPELVKIVDLDIMCRQQQVNDGCFSNIEEVPTHALTLTIPALITGDYMYCIVPSELKAQAVYNTLNGEISETCPASILRSKENAVLYLDKESSKLLDLLQSNEIL